MTANASSSSAKGGASTKSSTASKSRKSTQTATKRASGRGAAVRETGGRAIDVPVGAVLVARDRITGAVQPWASAEARSKEIKGLRRQVSSEIRRFERRGEEARRNAADLVRETGSRVSERVRTLA